MRKFFTLNRVMLMVGIIGIIGAVGTPFAFSAVTAAEEADGPRELTLDCYVDDEGKMYCSGLMPYMLSGKGGMSYDRAYVPFYSDTGEYKLTYATNNGARYVATGVSMRIGGRRKVTFLKRHSDWVALSQ